MECTDSFPMGNNETYYDSLTVDKIVYYDVLFFNDLNAKPFFAREIGIVQFIILTDIFSLIESHIQ